jgi:outer membrane protein assembly factor BamD
MVEGYQGLGMDDRAREVLKVLRDNAPDHKQLKKGKFQPKHA